MAKSNKNYVGVVALFIVLVGVVLAIVGVCIDWIKNDFGAAPLSDLFDVYGELELSIGDKFRSMASFAILTVIISGGTLVLAGITKLLGWKLIKLLLFIASVAAVVCAVIAMVTTFVFAGDKLLDCSPAAGAWLTTVGGVLAGIAGLGVAMKA